MLSLRQYQTDLVHSVYDSWKSNRRVMMQLPTGGGKTICFTKIVSDYVSQGKRILMFVHRKELVKQMAAKQDESLIAHNVIQAGKPTRADSLVQLGTVQTIGRRDASKLPKYDLIICDEAHHSTAKTYRNLYNVWPDAKILGVSATPCRLDGSGFDDLFDDLVCGPSVKQLIEWNYLSEFAVYSNTYRADTKMRMQGGDYHSKDLEAYAKTSMNNGDVVSTFQKHGEGKIGICFGVNKFHCNMIKEAYRNAGINADVIFAETSESERQRLIRDLNKRELQMLINVEIFTEGFDLPAIDIVQMARPTASLSLHLQMIGRGLRPYEGKEKALILDHAGNVGRHGRPDIDIEWNLTGVETEKTRERKPRIDIDEAILGDPQLPNDTYLDGESTLEEAFSSVKGGKIDPHSVDIEKLATGAEIALVNDPQMQLPKFAATLLALKDVAKKRGNKPTWVLYRLHELVEKRDLQYEERVIICRSLGYKPGFQYKMNEFLNPQPVTT